MLSPATTSAARVQSTSGAAKGQWISLNHCDLMGSISLAHHLPSGIPHTVTQVRYKLTANLIIGTSTTVTAPTLQHPHNGYRSRLQTWSTQF
jgi:hypothetical protein